MSNSIKAFLAIGFLAVVAACANSSDVEEYVVVEPAPITVEPVFTGKYN